MAYSVCLLYPAGLQGLIEQDSTLLRVATALATLAAVNAHGYIVSWTVDGQSRPGFDPSWDPSAKQKDTAQRHYFEKERGEYYACFQDYALTV